MALVATQIDNTWSYAGGKKQRYMNVDETSYTASGSTPASVSTNFPGFQSITSIVPQGLSDNGHIWRWDGTKVRAYKTGSGGGIITESWPDVLGGDSATAATTQASGAVNDEHIIAFVTATDTAKTTIVAEPNASASTPGNSAAGRNVVVSFNSAGGGALSADMGTATVVGTDQFGAAQTEVISLTALNGVTLTAGHFVWVVGTKVFATVTSLTLSVDVTADLADAEVALGIGTIFGLRGKITAESDIQSVRKDTADISSATYVGSATTHSIDMGADVADDVDIMVQYDAVASSLVDREAASAADIGTCTCLVIGTG